MSGGSAKEGDAVTPRRKCTRHSGGAALWCPDCGAFRPNSPKSKGWYYPDGYDAAMRRADIPDKQEAKP